MENNWASIPGANYTKVSVSIIEAEGLNGEALAVDAFCKVWIGRKKMRKDTQVAQNTDSPRWNETFVFAPVVSSDADFKWLLVECFDTAGPKNRDLGYFKYDLSSMKINTTVKGWFTLKDAPKGKILAEIKMWRANDAASSEVLRKSIREWSKQSGQKYCDPDFLADASSVVTPVPGKEQKSLLRALDSWKRPCEFLQEPKMFCNGIEAGDVVQGILGDCWFLGALAIVATRDDLLYPIVVEQAPECGFYTFKFFKDGEWIYVTVDDRLPLTKSNKLIYGHCQDKQEIWVPLMEKAYAKLHNCYQHLDGGVISQGLMDLTGEAAETFKWDKTKYPQNYEYFTKGTFFKELDHYVNEEKYLVGCSFQSDNGREEDMGMGIMSGHAYSILEVRQLQDDAGRELRLLKIRNPWGHLEWKGDWSDHSPLWTPRLKKLVNLSAENDGCFWIDWENFLVQYNNLMMLRLLQDEHGHKWDRKEIHSSFVGSSAGGSSANRVTWHLAPQYLLEVKKETTLFLCVQQEDRRAKGDYLKYPVGIGFDLRRDDSIDPRLPCILNPDAGLICSTDHFKGREQAKSMHLAAGRYRLIPSVYDVGTECKFYLAVFSYWPILLSPIRYNTLQLHGEWSASLSGGSLFTDQWVRNPKFRLHSEANNKTINVMVTLRQFGSPAPFPVDVYVLRCTPGAPVRKEHVLLKGDQQIASKLHVVYINLPNDDPNGLLLMPVTTDPGQLAKFEIRVYSPEIYNLVPEQ